MMIQPLTRKQRTENEIKALEARFTGVLVVSTPTGFTVWLDGRAIASAKTHRSPDRTFRALAARVAAAVRK